MINLVAKLLDTAKDAGVTPGGDSNNSLMMRMNGMASSTTMVKFIADDAAAARKKATENAFKQAHEKAQQMAEMAGTKLGPVLSMEETGAGGDKGMSLQERMVEMIYGNGAEYGPRRPAVDIEPAGRHAGKSELADSLCAAIWRSQQMKFAATTAIVFAVVCCGANSALPQSGVATGDGITVTGTGQVMVKPNKLQIEVRAAAAAELSADALVKYREAVHRAKETFGKLKIDGLQVAEQGLNVANNGVANQNVVYAAPGNAFIANNGGNAPGVKQEMVISKSMRLSVAAIDKLQEDQLVATVAKVLDGIRDAGLTTGVDPNNPNAQAEGQPANAVVMFVADNLVSAREKATDAAFQNAKEKAERIAKLAGGKLGTASSVEETTMFATNNEEAAALGMLSAIYSGGAVGADETALKSVMLVEMPVRVNLRVRFALTSGGGDK